MNESILRQSLTQLAMQSPTLLLYVVGVVLAWVFWRRCPIPSALTLLACGTLFLTAIALAVGQGVLLHMRVERDWKGEDLQRAMSILFFAGTLVRTVAAAMLLAAVFVGRERGDLEE